MSGSDKLQKIKQIDRATTVSLVKRRGILLVLSSPSGAGKSTLSRLLLEEGMLGLSISVTTRQRRPSEVDGIHYHFINIDEFERRRDNNEFAEWAKVHDNYYGTLRETVDKALDEGNDMLFDIDYQGAEQLQKKMTEDVVSIFILPPSMAELKSRLRRRAEDSEQVIAVRLENARLEMEHWRSYDYVLVNEDLNKTFAALKVIYEAETFKRHRAVHLDTLIDKLIAERVEF